MSHTRKTAGFVVAACMASGVAIVLPATSERFGYSAEASAPAPAYPSATQNYWPEGADGVFPKRASYPNDHGELGVLLDGEPVQTKGHPFFTVRENGRACVTCHQPADAMSLSTKTIQARWKAVGGKDPMFAPVDGANCPNLPRGERASHSLMLDHGLFRIARPWPPKDEYGQHVEPEFSIEVVSDPTGCNTSNVYGLTSDNPAISVYRRSRMTANLRYVVDVRTDLVFGLFSVKTGMPKIKDPDTGLRTNMNLMFDGRHVNLNRQAEGAATDHFQTQAMMAPEEVRQIVDFQRSIYSAQWRAPLVANFDDNGVPKGLGPKRLSTARASEAGDRLNTPTFQLFDEWKTEAITKSDHPTAKFKASVARGADLFMTKTFWIRDVWGITNGGSGNPMRRSCSTCHNSQMTGLDNSPGWFDIGTANWPKSGRQEHLPLFKVTCRPDVVAHPYLGRVIFTSDPGRALVSGKCVDVGSLTAHQLRALAPRGPYFSNGSVKNFDEVLDFYERRFGFSYTAQEREDLTNFLSVL